MPDMERILIVDGDRALVDQLTGLLLGQGRRVTAAPTIDEAVEAVAQTPVALILFGFPLGDSTSLEFLRRTRFQDPAAEVIVLVEPRDLDSAMRVVDGSTTGCLVKPVDPLRLDAIVRRVLERRALARDNARLSADLADRLRESEALLAISRASSSTLDVQEALRRICRELTLLVGADTGSVYVLDETSEHLKPCAGYHVPKEMLETLLATSLPLREQGFYLPLWREQRVIGSTDVAADPRFTHEAFRLFRHQSGLLVPLILNGEVAGAFYLAWWTQRRLLTDREHSLLETVAGQVTGFLHNAQLFEQTAREQRRLDVLYDLSRRLAAVHDTDALLALLVEEARRLLGAQAAGIRLLDGEDLVVGARTESAAAVMARPRIKVGQSLSGRVVASGEPLVVRDLHEDPRFDPVSKRGALELGYHGFLGVPLRIQGQVIGSLNCYTTDRRRFTGGEISLLLALADQASLAIHTAKLLREAEEGRHLVERLYRVAVSMQTSWERDDRLAAFARGACDAVGFDRISVLLATADGQNLELCSVYGDDTNLPPATLPLSPAAGPFFQAFNEKRVISMLRDEDLATIRPLDPVYRSHPAFRTKRFIVAPLVTADRAIGVAVADNKRSRKPIRPASVEPFALLCQQLAMALDEARLYAHSRAREREAIRLSAGLTLLNRAGRALHRTLDVEPMLDTALRELGRAFGAAGVLLNLFGENGAPGRSVGHWLSEAHGRAVTRRPGAGITSLIREMTTPLILPDIAQRRDIVHPAHFEYGVTSLAAFPVMGQQRVHGALLLYYTTPQAFPERDVHLLTAYANQLATALDNAHLYAETRRQQTRLAQIFDSTSDGIMLVNETHRIEAANRRAADLLEFDRRTMLGQEISAVLAECRAAAPDAARVLATLRSPAEGSDGEADGDLGVGSRILHWVARPTKSALGPALGSTLTLKDVTRDREIDRMKSEFVAFVTHQLRTPLSGIRWMLELTAAEPDLPAEVASYVQDARSSAERLIGLVNDLLNISRLERGNLAVAPQAVRLWEVTQSVIDEMGPLIREKAHRLSLDGDRDLAVMTDPQLVREVILNLVSNAVKYTPARGAIAIRLDREEGSAGRWSVQDTGVGVPRQSQSMVFEKFHRAENVLALETEGTGLGLYLVRLIVEQFGGRVWCESEEGHGSLFAFTLPLAKEEHGNGHH